MNWWSRCTPREEKKAVLIQFDLKGHSQWSAGTNVRRERAFERTDFALGLRERVSEFGFDCLYWLGDGGVFARADDGKGEAAAAALPAVDVAFNWFRRFQGWVDKGQELGLRATGTIVEVVIHPDGSNWFSTDLNEFLKHERQIGKPGAFVITERLYSELRSAKSRFSGPLPVDLSGRPVNVHIDKEHPVTAWASNNRFTRWLLLNKTSFPRPSYSTSGMREHDVAIGNCVIVHSALDVAGYEPPNLRRIEYDWTKLDKLMTRKSPLWRDRIIDAAKRTETKERTGTKASPVRIEFPNTSAPDFEIELSHVPFSVALTFQKLTADKPDIQKALVEKAFAFESAGGRVIPGILCMHVIVLVADVAVGGRLSNLLLAHRVFKEHSYSGMTWSASFEEHFAPLKSTWGGRERPEDTTITESVVRGLREEFVTEGFSDPIDVSFHASVIELENLNFSMIAVVKLPNTSFSQLQELWRRADDSEDHDALAVLPLDKATLWSALKNAGPGDLLQSYLGPSKSKHRRDPWHPSSAARIACCLWMLENDLLS